MVQRELRLHRISIHASTSLSLYSLVSVLQGSRLLPASLACNPSLFPPSWFPLHSLVFIGMSLSAVLRGPSEEDVLCSLHGNVPHGALP